MFRSLVVRTSLALALLLGAVGLSSVTGARLFAPQTATAQTSDSVWAIVGDYGSGDANAAAVAALVKSWSPIYVVTNGDGYRAEAGGSGDTKYDNSTGAFYCPFMGGIATSGAKCPTPGGSSNNRFYAALGNHDYTDAGATNNLPTTYTNYFSLPGPGTVSNGNSGNERYYDLVQGSIHFYIINSNNGAGQEPDGTSSTSAQATWLKNRLAASSSPWKIVVFHHPPYSSGSHGSNAWMQWPFAQWGANVVIAGHDHDYERILRDGVVYFVNGTGGATENTYNCATRVTGSQVCLDQMFGAQRVTANSTSLTFDFITVDGVLRDSYTLTKSAPANTPTTTATSLPPTATSAPTSTSTPRPANTPTATATTPPPTNTTVPPTQTSTPVPTSPPPATATAMPPTASPAPSSTWTSTPIRTNTPAPAPTSTATSSKKGRKTATPTTIPAATIAPSPTPARTNTPVPTQTATVAPSATPTRTNTPTTVPSATPTRTVAPTATPTTPPAAGCSLLGQPTSGPYCWGIIGSDSTRNSSEYGIGVRHKLFTLRWREFAPSEGTVDSNYVSRKQTELAQLRQAGLRPILSLGVHDAPAWLHTNYANSYYVDQYGDIYSDGLDCGDANLVFNPTLRSLAAAYIQNVFATFGTNFAAVRLGGGRYGELTYPPASFGGKSNLYWNYDANALAQSPLPNWHPGDPSPSGQAQTFLRWHLDALTEFQNWQISLLRQLNYQGPLMMLYPSWGIRPGDFDKAVATNLNGSSSAEINGEIQRGFDFQSQIAAITDPQVIVTSTWMDADASRDGGTDQRYWSPVHYLAYLAHAHALHLSAFGENTGHGQRAKMDLSTSQMKKYGLTGMMWYNETELFSGTYATLTDYQQVIAAYGG